MPNKVRILIIGDIIGKGARNAFTCFLPTLKEKYNYDLLVTNCENITHGRGMSLKHYNLMNNLGVDVMTMGNHVLDNKEINSYISNTTNLVVPGNVNYQDVVFNDHKEVKVNFNGYTIKFINLLKTLNLKEKFDLTEPTDYFDSIYQNDPSSIYVVDYHAELTLVKNVLGYYLDGRASLVYGTHTHVQTSDERILPNGCGFISDVGMCGAIDSVIGYDYKSFLNKMKGEGSTFVAENGPYMINGLVAEIDLDSKKTTSLIRINERL